MRIAIAADHNGTALKRDLIAVLEAEGHEVTDLGVDDDEVVDYPALCVELCTAVVEGRADRAVMIGGTGSGETIACNKIPGIRATMCHLEYLAEIARANNDGNVLVLGAKVVAPALAERLLRVWLTTPFSGGRHQDRLDQIAAIEADLQG